MAMRHEHIAALASPTLFVTRDSTGGLHIASVQVRGRLGIFNLQLQPPNFNNAGGRKEWIGLICGRGSWGCRCWLMGTCSGSS